MGLKNNLFPYYYKEKTTESSKVVCSILNEVINKICQSSKREGCHRFLDVSMVESARYN